MAVKLISDITINQKPNNVIFRKQRLNILTSESIHLQRKCT